MHGISVFVVERKQGKYKKIKEYFMNVSKRKLNCDIDSLNRFFRNLYQIQHSDFRNSNVGRVFRGRKNGV